MLFAHYDTSSVLDWFMPTAMHCTTEADKKVFMITRTEKNSCKRLEVWFFLQYRVNQSQAEVRCFCGTDRPQLRQRQFTFLYYRLIYYYIMFWVRVILSPIGDIQIFGIFFNCLNGHGGAKSGQPLGSPKTFPWVCHHLVSIRHVENLTPYLQRLWCIL